MARALLFVILLGAFFGLLLPSGEPDAPVAQAAPAPAPSRPPVPTRVRRSGDRQFYVHAMVNRQLVRFMVDTGATSIALTAEDAERIGIAVDPKNFEVVGYGASGPVHGQQIRLQTVELDGKLVADLQAVVADGLDVSLLGQTFLSRMASVRMARDEMIIE